MKIIVLGDVAVGKSSLLKKYQSNYFTHETQATVGIDFIIKNFDINNENHSVHIWDTSGLERYECITASYVRAVDALILVYSVDSKKSFCLYKRALASFVIKTEY